MLCFEVRILILVQSRKIDRSISVSFFNFAKMKNSTINQITAYLEQLVPLASQESYDNCGLLVGDKNTEVTNVLISLDCTEQIVEEAIQKNCQLIISHHPLLFKGIKKLTGGDYVQRTLIKCIQNNIAIYAIHTNLDNYRFGVNYEISNRLNLMNAQIVLPKNQSLSKLVTYVPLSHVDEVTNTLFTAGAGRIGNYEECHFRTVGSGTYKPMEMANPFEGSVDQRSEVEEAKIEFLVENTRMEFIVNQLKLVHPYEEVAYDVVALQNSNAHEGAGMIGELQEPMDEIEFIKNVKEIFQCGVVKYTRLLDQPIKKVAVCGGSGSFLVQQAIAQGADVFVTSDMKYHEFFDADDRILILDIGHYESEQYTKHLIADILKKNFTNFAIHLTERNTNPINYW